MKEEGRLAVEMLAIWKANMNDAIMQSKVYASHYLAYASWSRLRDLWMTPKDAIVGH